MQALLGRLASTVCRITPGCHQQRQVIGEDAEREHIRRSVEILEQVVGSRPLGWYTGRTSPNTRRLVAEHGGFLYDADAYDDDLPYWTTVDGCEPQLIVP